MVDMAHFAGLVASTSREISTPFTCPHRHDDDARDPAQGRGVVWSSAPRFKEHVDQGCPLVLGGPTCRT